jgi:hypothetical protein
MYQAGSKKNRTLKKQCYNRINHTGNDYIDFPIAHDYFPTAYDFDHYDSGMEQRMFCPYFTH